MICSFLKAEFLRNVSRLENEISRMQERIRGIKKKTIQIKGLDFTQNAATFIFHQTHSKEVILQVIRHADRAIVVFFRSNIFVSNIFCMGKY